MDIIDMNSLNSFVGDMEVSCETIQNVISLDEDDPIENEIITCISQIEGAVLELDRLSRLSNQKIFAEFST